jgi:hypothetical protein
MALKTVETKKSVTTFVDSIRGESQRKDTKYLISLIKKITGESPKIWGDNFIIGFGKYKYHRKNSKEELEWFRVGLAPRKSKITLYLTCYLDKEPLVKKLGRCKYGKGCLHINKLGDVDLDVLKKLITKYKDSKWFG